MVKVLVINSNWGYTKITAEGHASEPRICSAVSAVMWGLAGMMLNINDKPNINSMVMHSGHHELDVTPMSNERSQEIIDTCFKFALVSLSQIEKQYPGEIEIVTR